MAGGGDGGDPLEPWNIKVSLFSILIAFNEYKSMNPIETNKKSNILWHAEQQR